MKLDTSDRIVRGYLALIATILFPLVVMFIGHVLTH